MRFPHPRRTFIIVLMIPCFSCKKIVSIYSIYCLCFSLKINKLQFFFTEFIVKISIQYSQRHSVINHCDRHITLLSDTCTDISFSLFNLFTYFDMPFG